MEKNRIHPSAVIEEGAIIGNNVTIEPFVVIKGNVILEDDVTIKAHAYIDGRTRIGKGTVIWPFVSIGTKAQDLKYRGEKTYVLIGKYCEIREYATINSSTFEGNTVKVGDHCLIMACCHIAHNCMVGDHVIMSNNSILAGHVTVEDYAIIGGMTPVHQYTRIGCHAMVGGMSRVTNDVPPYTIGGGIPYALGGINRIGLKRRQFSFESRKALAKAFRYVYRMCLPLETAIKKIEEELGHFHEVSHFADFCRISKRGLIGMQGIRNKTNERFSDEEEEVFSQKMNDDLLMKLSARSQ